MKISMLRSSLSEAVSGLSLVAPAKTSLPILKHVLVTSERSVLKMQASSLDQHATYTFSSVEPVPVKLCLPLSHLRRILALSSDDIVTIEARDGTAEMSCGSARVRCFTADVADFPKTPPEPERAIPRDINFLTSYRAASVFASRDVERKILNGVCVKPHKMEATDGKRLIVLNCPTVGIVEDCADVVPLTQFLLRAKIKSVSQVAFHQGNFWMAAGAWSYCARMPEGAWPNTRQVIPSRRGTNGFTLTASHAAMLAKRLPLLHPDGAYPAFATICGGALSLSTNHPDDGETSIASSVASALWVGEHFKPALNRRFMADALKQGFLDWNFEDEFSPALATRADGSLCVIMPMRVR